MSSYNKFPLGHTIVLRATLKNADEALTDPTTVRMWVEKPDGSEIAYIYPTDGIIVRRSLGVYELEQTLDQSGIWKWKTQGEGTLKVMSFDKRFLVEKSGLNP